MTFIRHLPIVFKSRNLAIRSKKLKNKSTASAQTRQTPQTLKAKLTKQSNKRTPRTAKGRVSFSQCSHKLLPSTDKFWIIEAIPWHKKYKLSRSYLISRSKLNLPYIMVYISFFHYANRVTLNSTMLFLAHQ